MPAKKRAAKRARKNTAPHGRVSERGRGTSTQAAAKRRLRSIKRESGPAKEGKGPAPQGQRKAIRGNRTRQRRT